MKATVQLINPKRGIYAAEIEGSREFVVFELLDFSDPELGDVIIHPDFHSMGGETFTNLTQGCEFDVSVEDVCGKNLVRQHCLL